MTNFTSLHITSLYAPTTAASASRVESDALRRKGRRRRVLMMTDRSALDRCLGATLNATVQGKGKERRGRVR